MLMLSKLQPKMSLW